MDDRTKASIIISIIAIIVIGYLYSQGWFAQVTPYLEEVFKVISSL